MANTCAYYYMYMQIDFPLQLNVLKDLMRPYYWAGAIARSDKVGYARQRTS